MNSNTIKKLQEAIFFYGKLTQAAESLTNEVIYYLSAFLSATQSVIDIMKKEFKPNNRKQFENWYSNHQFVTSESFNKFDRARNVILHQELPKEKYRFKTTFGPNGLTVGARGIVNIPLKPFAGLKTNVQMEHINQKGEKSYSSADQSRNLYVSFFDNQRSQREEILFASFLEEAKEYTIALEEFIAECETKFSD